MTTDRHELDRRLELLAKRAEIRRHPHSIPISTDREEIERRISRLQNLVQIRKKDY